MCLLSLFLGVRRAQRRMCMERQGTVEPSRRASRGAPITLRKGPPAVPRMLSGGDPRTDRNEVYCELEPWGTPDSSVTLQLTTWAAHDEESLVGRAGMRPSMGPSKKTYLMVSEAMKMTWRGGISRESCCFDILELNPDEWF